ncbi:hypothetical protein PIROE2DRAFT_68436 [Piromyces sp. E2]|nr:hypothetical protein PIROE2DRAFT_68436 [Piromyces sp. E2]|eukprot:OUM70281.1 hypothetical protein PIROE2DRAFT_68436 [Piromyces sp. E2]
MKHVTGKGEEKEKQKSEIKTRDGFSVIKIALLLTFIVAFAKYFDNKQKGCYICACLPYILFESINIYQDFIKFKAGVEGIKTGKDVNTFSLKSNIYLKYLIGINNAKCEMNKEGKKGACTSLAIALYALNIFKTDALRFIQNVLFFIVLKIEPSFYMIFFTPTFLLMVTTIAEIVIQGKIGYIRASHESLISFFWMAAYIVINLDLIFTLFSLDIRVADFVTHSFLFLFEVAVLCGFVLGVLPFVPIMEYKMKHDETDVPL